MISIQQIRAARDRFTGVPPKAETLGVDVARFGENETVIVARAGQIVWIVSRSKREDTMRTVGRIEQAMKDLSAERVIVDDIGVGGGVVDRLKERHVPVTGFIAGGAAKDSAHFANAKAEASWKVREVFEAGEIAICPDEDLFAQLTGIRYGIDSSQKLRIESKDDARSRGFPSPDIADAVVLAFSGRGRFSLPGRIGEINNALWRENPWLRD